MSGDVVRPRHSEVAGVVSRVSTSAHGLDFTFTWGGVWDDADAGGVDPRVSVLRGRERKRKRARLW